ncbi:ORF9 [Siadenovirus carbocapituli]|uniref:ORF9 n=1 Tax=Siadenovirus sp. TaxID=2671519 RepID=A0A9E7QY60_9ADEN|nr:ORF9 [Siadenovirus sp.]
MEPNLLVQLHSSYLYYVGRDTALADLPPGLQMTLKRIVCPSPVLLLFSSTNRVANIETHCHCETESHIHSLLCYAWQVYIKHRCEILFGNAP